MRASTPKDSLTNRDRSYGLHHERKRSCDDSGFDMPPLPFLAKRERPINPEGQK